MPDEVPIESTVTLLIRARAGQREAEETLFARYLPVLHRWARGRLPRYARGSMDTDDLVQVTLLRALRNIDDFEVRREGAFLAYLRSILLNRLRDEVRSTVRRPGHESLNEPLRSASPTAIEIAIGRQMTERYEQALERLTERQREAVILRLEFGYDHKRLAEAIEAPSADAARMVVARALLRVAEVMDAAD